jgi:hypothetical protein
MLSILWIIKKLSYSHSSCIVSFQCQVKFLDQIISKVNNRRELGQHLEALLMLYAKVKNWVLQLVRLVIVKTLYQLLIINETCQSVKG